MPQHYTEQTQRILQDFLDVLEQKATVDRTFLTDIRSMACNGMLANQAGFRAAIANLEKSFGDQVDGLHD